MCEEDQAGPTECLCGEKKLVKLLGLCWAMNWDLGHLLNYRALWMAGGMGHEGKAKSS